MRIGTLHPKARVTNSGGLTGQRKGAKEDNGGGDAENRRKPPKDSDNQRPVKDEKDRLLQEKDKLRQMAEGEIERLKEDLRQQKDREDRARSQINRKLKQKTDDFERLHRDHKRLDAEHKKLITECDWQQEKIRELQNEVTKKTEALAKERTKAVESASYWRKRHETGWSSLSSIMRRRNK